MARREDNVVSVRVSTDTHKRLAEHKKKTGTSIIFVIDKAVNEYLDKKEKQYDG